MRVLLCDNENVQTTLVDDSHGWRWCYVVDREGKIRWNVVSHVSKCRLLLYCVWGSCSEWCGASGVVGGGATWQSAPSSPLLEYPPPSPPVCSSPPPYPPQVHSLCNRPPLARTGCWCKIFPPCTVLREFNHTDEVDGRGDTFALTMVA